MSSWTQQDLNQLLSNSPWALQVNATMDDPADKPAEPSTGVPAEVSQAGLPANAKLGATARWDGGIGRNRMGHLATIPVTVRWDSAAVVRYALKAKHDAELDAVTSTAQENFIITVIGLLPAKQVKAPASLKAASSSDDSAPVRTTEETLEWFMASSRLASKGVSALQPQNVTIDAETGTVHLFFKRSEALGSKKRDVFFTTRFGTMNVEARFRTKDMLFDGQPDL